RAGRRAAQHAAYAEAVGSLTRALDLLSQLPESADRARQELELGQSLVQFLAATKGGAAPETIAAAARAAALAQQSGTLAQLIDATVSSCVIALNAGALPDASALADQALRLARREGSPGCLAAARQLHINALFWRGDLAAVEEHFATWQVLFDDPRFLRQLLPPVEALGLASLNAYFLGRVNIAHDRIAQALAAADLNHPFDVPYVEVFAVVLRLLLRDYEHAEALAARVLAQVEKHQFALLVASFRCALGLARAKRGRAGEGVALMRQGIAGFLEGGFRTNLPIWIGQLAEAQACAGAVGDALATVEQALPTNPDVLVWRPENLRLRGELRLTQRQTDLAETDFREAIMLARRIGAKASELGATVSLARLLAQQGRRDEARTMLAEIYNWFTEGFDTVD